jgi:hypothetical protein
MIGMPIAPIRAKRHHDIGLEVTDRCSHMTSKRSPGYLRERAIAIVQAFDTLHTKPRTCSP